MADQNRQRSIEDESLGQPSSENEELTESNESRRERSNDEPASMADDRGLSDELDSDSELEELDDESSIEDDEEMSSR